jgi:uncharacterized coiled-coil DUF342 family protein
MVYLSMTYYNTMQQTLSHEELSKLPEKYLEIRKRILATYDEFAREDDEMGEYIKNLEKEVGELEIKLADMDKEITCGRVEVEQLKNDNRKLRSVNEKLKNERNLLEQMEYPYMGDDGTEE